MVHLLFVLDGPRDDVMIPILVEKIIDSSIQPETMHWKDNHLHQGGYDKKLLLATRRAKDRDLQGVVAVVDRDKEKKGKRLQKLKTAREHDRENLPPFPTALGEANPHGEAWILDDAVAIRQTLQLSETVSIPRLCRETH